MDVTANSVLVYSGGRSASLVSSFRVELPCEAFVIGTKGIIKVRLCEVADKHVNFPISFVKSSTPEHEC